MAVLADGKQMLDAFDAVFRCYYPNNLIEL